MRFGLVVANRPQGPDGLGTDGLVRFVQGRDQGLDDIAPDADGPETPPPSQEDDPGGNPYL